MRTSMGLVSIIFATAANGFIDWVNQHLLACPFKKMFSIDCPGCGLQRSIVALMEGDIVKSLKFYPATLPIIGLLLFTLIHLKFELKKGAFFIKFFYILITFIIVSNYIYKIINHQLI
jgi:hypothetical protein